MKFSISLLLGLLILFIAQGVLFGQSSKKTIILIRHAEKEVSDQNDPDRKSTV